ncbi:MAG: GAF domain-containing protein [Endomicrobiales bacterium]|nr:GAF domain-containing protein [Endomicrobiales bacterium]
MPYSRITIIYIISSIGFINFLLTIFGLIKISKSNFLKSYFISFATLTTLWVFSNYNQAYPESIFWCRFSYAVASFAISTATALILAFSKQSKLSKLNLSVIHGIGLFIFIASFIDGFFFSYSPTHKFEDYFATFFPIYSLYLLISISLWFYKLIICSKTFKGIQRQQARYIILGILGAGGFAFIVSCLLPIFGYTQFIIFDTSGTLIFVGCTAYAIAKYRLMDIKVAITKAGLVFTISMAVLLLPFYVGYNTQNWALSTTFAVILATIGQLAYRTLQKKAEDILLSEQRNYQKILLQAANGMIKIHDIKKLSKLSVYLLERTIKIDFAVLFINDSENDTYNLEAVRELQKTEWKQKVPHNSKFVSYLNMIKDPILYEEFPEDTRKSLEMPFRIVLAIPSITENKLLGFILLGEKLNKKHYTNDDINVFRILSKQIALSMENCIFIEQFKNAQEKIFNAEKLASIGGLSEGMAHQINNKLTHFFINLEELRFQIDDYLKNNIETINNNPELKKKFDYFTTITNSLITNAKRTDEIVKGILGYARVEAKETFFSRFSLREIINLSIDLLKVKYEIQSFPLEIAISTPDDLIYGVKSQLAESIYNILDNGYESTIEKVDHIPIEHRKSFSPHITLELSQNENSSIIIISDNGIGIRDENKNKMFAPFFTTKSYSKSGTGIGMYVVKRMIEENHHGKVTFKSKYGNGTQFFIELPKKPHRDKNLELDF